MGQADDIMEARLHDTFDHQLGDLGQRPPVPAASPPPSSEVDMDNELAKLVQILRNPSSIRQAIILREIIERPEYRW